MLEHHDEGALGVIINRPTPEQLDEPLDRWVDLQSSPNGVFAGGPVEPDALIALAYTREPISVSPRSSTVATEMVSADLTVDPALVAADLEAVRIFRGYSGLGSGQQLRRRAGAWLVLDRRGDRCVRARTGGAVARPSCAARADAWHGSPAPPTTSAPTDRQPRSVCFRRPVASSDADSSSLRWHGRRGRAGGRGTRRR